MMTFVMLYLYPLGNTYFYSDSCLKPYIEFLFDFHFLLFNMNSRTVAQKRRMFFKDALQNNYLQQSHSNPYIYPVFVFIL